MANEPLYLTTPLYYVNAEPHLGHFYATMLGDVLARYWRARGRSVFTLTGTDEHGDKVAQAAAKAGVEPKTHADRLSAIFRETWGLMVETINGIRFSNNFRDIQNTTTTFTINIS